jgi:hypothetical protein
MPAGPVNRLGGAFDVRNRGDQIWGTGWRGRLPPPGKKVLPVPDRALAGFLGLQLFSVNCSVNSAKFNCAVNSLHNYTCSVASLNLVPVNTGSFEVDPVRRVLQRVWKIEKWFWFFLKFPELSLYYVPRPIFTTRLEFVWDSGKEIPKDHTFCTTLFLFVSTSFPWAAHDVYRTWASQGGLLIIVSNPPQAACVPWIYEDLAESTPLRINPTYIRPQHRDIAPRSILF